MTTKPQTVPRPPPWRALQASFERLVPPESPAGKLLGRLPWMDWLLLIIAGAMVFGPVTMTWNTNPNYSFGWWIPFVAVFLFYERWATRPVPIAGRESSTLTLWLASGGVIYFIFRLASEADPDWRPGLWVMTLLYVGGLLAWLRFYGGSGWLRHFAFPVCFLLLSVPWFYEIENPLTQDLMRMNAILVAFSLQVLGVSADALGNVIQLENCQLGVEEACSGILSLQASLVMGLLLGEIYRLPVSRRLQLIAICLASALVGNYLRTFFLGIMASFNGSGAVTEWHDTAGFSILILTALTGWIACLALSGNKANEVGRAAGKKQIPAAKTVSFSASRLALGIFAVVLAVEGMTQGWFLWKESSLERHPTWSLRLPADSKSVPISKVALAALMCDSSNAATWTDAAGAVWTGMWFEYKPKPSNQVVMSWHTPENCLPSVGWVRQADYDDFTTSVNGANLKVRPMKFLSGTSPIFVFWVVYPTKGSLPSRIVNNSHLSLRDKVQTHLHDVWTGNRGVGLETLEMAVTGMDNYEAAKSAYIGQLQALVQTR